MNIGLVLSGGMAKGAYQIGALRALNTFVPVEEIRFISCASIGVLNGYAYITNKLDCAESMWNHICDTDTRVIIGRILKSSLLRRDIESLHDEKDCFSSVFYAALLDISHRNIVYRNLLSVDKSKISDYLKASVSMPIYNRAVSIDGSLFFDGAMVDNIPVYPLLKHNLDYIICIYFDDVCYKFENTYFDNKVVKITFPGESLIKQSVVFCQDRIESMINEGFERTTDVLSGVFRNGFQDTETIYRTIESRNQSQISRLRVTGDVLVTNLNRVTQKLAKRKIIN